MFGCQKNGFDRSVEFSRERLIWRRRRLSAASLLSYHCHRSLLMPVCTVQYLPTSVQKTETAKRREQVYRMYKIFILSGV